MSSEWIQLYIPWRKHHLSTSAVSHLVQSWKQPHQSWSVFWSKRLVSNTTLTTANPKRHVAKQLNTTKRLATQNGTSPNSSTRLNDCQPKKRHVGKQLNTTLTTANPKRHVAKQVNTTKRRPTHNGTSPNSSTRLNDYQPNGYSHQNDLPKQLLSINGLWVTKRLKTTLRKSSSSPSFTRPCYNLPDRYQPKTYIHQNGLPKQLILNSQCSPNTNAVLSRQHRRVANSPSLSRTTNAVNYNRSQLQELLACRSLRISVL